MTENRENRTENVARSSKNAKHNRFDEQERNAEAVAAERTGCTNTVHDMLSGPEQGPPPGRWDSVGEPGEGLDERQGLYAADATGQEHLPERGDEPSPAADGSAFPGPTTFTSSLWDKHRWRSTGKRSRRLKVKPFRVMSVTPGKGVTVSPLDGGQEWDVPAQELETGSLAVSQGVELDGVLASIRLQEAGLESAHPEYVAGLLQAISDEQTDGSASQPGTNWA